MTITYRTDLSQVNWKEMKRVLSRDWFDNGRTADQLQRSFENSHSACVAYSDQQIVGTARVLSDGVCNAYIVDVWTLSSFRRRGIGRAMMELLLESVRGQHVYLFTDDGVEFYRKLGFAIRPTGLELVVGDWLKG
jgi:ribosomal protein S18 acetylase RimI-like enzyme